MLHANVALLTALEVPPRWGIYMLIGRNVTCGGSMLLLGCDSARGAVLGDHPDFRRHGGVTNVPWLAWACSQRPL